MREEKFFIEDVLPVDFLKTVAGNNYLLSKPASFAARSEVVLVNFVARQLHFAARCTFDTGSGLG
jgi:hypothetical protein